MNQQKVIVYLNVTKLRDTMDEGITRILEKHLSVYPEAEPARAQMRESIKKSTMELLDACIKAKASTDVAMTEDAAVKISDLSKQKKPGPRLINQKDGVIKTGVVSGSK